MNPGSFVPHVSLQAYGGDGYLQRIKRVAFDAKSTVMVSGQESGGDVRGDLWFHP